MCAGGRSRAGAQANVARFSMSTCTASSGPFKKAPNLGTSTGAYLLGLWGVPITNVIAVACHHHPSRFSDSEFSSLTAVHIAEALLGAEEDTALDMAYLAKLGIADHVPMWEAVRYDVMSGR